MNILKKIFTHPYVIAGIIVFLLLFFIGLYNEFSVTESLFGSFALAVIAVGTAWWNREVW